MFRIIGTDRDQLSGKTMWVLELDGGAVITVSTRELKRRRAALGN